MSSFIPRAKFHKLKYGVDMPSSGGQPDDANQFNSDPLLDDSILNNGDSSTTAGVNWKHGRQLLRQYLQVGIFECRTTR